MFIRAGQGADDRARRSRLLSRRQMLSTTAMGGVVLLGSGFIASCEGSGGTASIGAGGLPQVDKITWAIGSGLPHLDVGSEFHAGIWTYTSHAQESPMRLGADGELQPALAESWEQPDDETIVLTLRQGVKFHDGTEMTAEDVAFSLSRNFAGPTPTGPGAVYYGKVDSVTATGRHEVTIKFSEVDPYFPYVLAHPATFISSKAFLEKAGKDLGSPRALPLGTGPLKFTSFNPRTGIEMTRHDEYWGEPLPWKEFSLRFIPDAQTRLLAFQSGEVDGVFDVPSDNTTPWQQVGTIGVTQGYLVNGWSFPVDEAPFDDVHVRRSVAYATDSAGLAKIVAPGAQPAKAAIHPSVLKDLTSQQEIDELYDSLPTYEFDMDKARQELAQSAHPKGFTAKVVVPNTFPEVQALALNTAQNLKALGITFEVEQRPEESVQGPLWLGLPPHENHQGVGLLPRLVGPALPDPGPSLESYYSTEAIQVGNHNSMRYSNKRVDELLERAASTADKKQRFDAYGEVLRIVQDELPFHASYHGGTVVSIKKPWSWNDSAMNQWLVLRQWLREIRG